MWRGMTRPTHSRRTRSSPARPTGCSFQYAPYEAGAGKVYWVKDRRGAEVPVITARYSIWADANTRPRAGTPAKVAREIREPRAATAPADLPRYDWAIAHAWSYFRHVPGTDE